MHAHVYTPALTASERPTPRTTVRPTKCRRPTDASFMSMVTHLDEAFFLLKPPFIVLIALFLVSERKSTVLGDIRPFQRLINTHFFKRRDSSCFILFLVFSFFFLFFFFFFLFFSPLPPTPGESKDTHVRRGPRGGLGQGGGVS